jgi:hypothetical protein
MKITTEMKEKIFSKWIYAGDNCGLREFKTNHKYYISKEGFDYALSLILPLLDKSLEANRVARVIRSEQEAEVVEDFAHQAIKEIESELKKLGGGE